MQGTSRMVGLDEVAKRPARRWIETGLFEIDFGAMILLPGCIFLLADRLPHGSRVGQVYSLLAPWLWFGSALAIPRVRKRLLPKIVLSRAGPVAYQVATLDLAGVLFAVPWRGGILGRRRGGGFPLGAHRAWRGDAFERLIAMEKFCQDPSDRCGRGVVSEETMDETGGLQAETRPAHPAAADPKEA
jgi:hypothetical protein